LLLFFQDAHLERTGRFVQPEKCKAAIGEYRRDVNPGIGVRDSSEVATETIERCQQWQ
jgi:hypothetical protein